MLTLHNRRSEALLGTRGQPGFRPSKLALPVRSRSPAPVPPSKRGPTLALIPLWCNGFQHPWLRSGRRRAGSWDSQPAQFPLSGGPCGSRDHLAAPSAGDLKPRDSLSLWPRGDLRPTPRLVAAWDPGQPGARSETDAIRVLRRSGLVSHADPTNHRFEQPSESATGAKRIRDSMSANPRPSSDEVALGRVEFRS